MAALIGATVTAQVARIAATPIPKYAEGGVSPRDEKAMINDGGNQEFVERNGVIYTTKQKNAIVDLKKNDIIHKDFDTLQRKSMILTAINDGNGIKDDDLIDMFGGIETSIKKGFKDAKINNHISVMQGFNPYKESLKNWN